VVWWELLKVSDELTDREVGTVFGHGLMVLLVARIARRSWSSRFSVVDSGRREPT
jgi:hypothetical protein